MIFNWKIPYENSLDKMSNEQLSDFIMTNFGLTDNEIKIENDHIEGTPTSLTLTNWISGIRLAVYDIILTNDKNKKVLTIKIRLFKILVISLLFLLPSFFDSGDFLLIGLIGYFGSVVFFGIIATIELYSAKSGIEKKIKNVCQQSLK